MTTRRRPSAFRGRSRPRRASEWYDVSISETLTANQQDLTDLSTNVEPSHRKGSSIVRTILDLQFIPATANVQLSVDIGLVLMELDAFASVVAPDPAIDDDQPGWLYRGSRTARTGDTNNPNPQSLQLDLKSRRKFPGEDVLYTLILERDSAVGSLFIKGLIRFLLLRP